MVEIRNLTVSYGQIEALRNVSLSVNEGQIVSIIGSNGAGKTTLLNAISALVPVRSGSRLFRGRELPKVPHLVVKAGIVQVPEGRKVFAGLTVRENLLMGGYLQSRAEFIDQLEQIFALFPVLKERQNQYAATLSGGEQQMLAIGRALMSRPKVMLLDEPSLGLSPLMVNTVYTLINQIRKTVTILLVEQNAKKALSVCDYAYVLENGSIVLEGDGKVLLHNPEVKKAYLGEAIS